MPTIEIASINSTGLGLNQADFDIAIIEETKLESHRGLFYHFLRKQNGVIIHIGNPDFKENKKGGFFAGQIVDWSFESDEEQLISSDIGTENQEEVPQQRFKFKDKHKSDIDRLLQASMKSSPNSKIYFLTDYQFGPEQGTFEITNTILDFWILHDKKGLKFNALYEIHGQ
jgi:hypothetical protein